MRARQLIRIHSSKLHLMKLGERLFYKDLKTIDEALSLWKPALTPLLPWLPALLNPS